MTTSLTYNQRHQSSTATPDHSQYHLAAVSPPSSFDLSHDDNAPARQGRAVRPDLEEEEVSRTKFKGDPILAKALAEAKQLELSVEPKSHGAAALIDSILAALPGGGAPKKSKRGRKGRGDLTQAVGAIVGNVLLAWMPKQRLVHRSRMASGFVGEALGRTIYLTAIDALVAAGLVAIKSGIRFQGPFGDSIGRAERIGPTDKLLALSGQYGLTAETIREDFRTKTATEAPPAPSKLVEVFEMPRRRRTAARIDPVRTAQKMKVPAASLEFVSWDVDEQNALAAHYSFTGCRPPVWYRPFAGSLSLGGRWYVPGGGGNYQTMKKDDRRAILIDGKPVVMLDIKAAHLTILVGLTGGVLHDDDPYAIAGGIPRDAVKQWIMLALGSGKMRSRWSAETSPDVRQFPVTRVGNAVASAYPIFRNLDEAVVYNAMGLNKLVPLGEHSHLITHRLQNIEAEALTMALRDLREAGVLALPLHDELIVQQDHEDAARAALEAAYVSVCGLKPVIKREAQCLPSELKTLFSSTKGNQSDRKQPNHDELA